MHYKRPESLIQNPMQQEHSVFVQEQRIVLYLYKDIKEINKYINYYYPQSASQCKTISWQKGKTFCDRKGSVLHVVYFSEWNHLKTEKGKCFIIILSMSQCETILWQKVEVPHVVYVSGRNHFMTERESASCGLCLSVKPFHDREWKVPHVVYVSGWNHFKIESGKCLMWSMSQGETVS